MHFDLVDLRLMVRIAEANGLAILPGSAARRHALAMAIDTVPLSDDWALRRMQVCVRNLAALPVFARDLVDLLVADALAAGPPQVCEEPAHKQIRPGQ